MHRVAFINPDVPHPNFVTYALFPEYGTHLLATTVRDAGYDVRLFVERIAPIDWHWLLAADAVCIHTFSCTIPKLANLAKRIRAKRPLLPIIAGGTHASIMPEDTLQYCDVVVRKEGDTTLLDLLSHLFNDTPLSDVKGIAYRNANQICITPDRPFVPAQDTIPDLDLIHGYARWTLMRRFWNHKAYLQLLQTSRGCPYKCSFCVAPRELGNQYRVRDIDRVIDDIHYQLQSGKTRRFFIVDNHFTVNATHTKTLLRRIIEARIGWSATCFTRIEVSEDDELLELLLRAGVRLLYIGLESFDDDVLRVLNKQQTGIAARKAVRRIRAAGLKVLGSFVVGNDEETSTTIERTVDAAIEEDLEFLVMFPLGGFPEVNSPTVPLNRFLVDDWTRLDATHVAYLPKLMRPSALQRAINRGYKRFYSARQVFRRLLQGDVRSALQRVAFLQFAKQIRRGTETWAKRLEVLEAPFYGESGQLIETRLPSAVHPAMHVGGRRARSSAPAIVGRRAPGDREEAAV